MKNVERRKMNREQRFNQIDRADSIKTVKKADLKKSLDMVQTLKGDANKTSEQELFVAIVHDSLGKVDSKLQTKFANKLPELVNKVGQFDSENSVFRGAKRALKQLVKGKDLARGAGKIIRKFALGKAQLDNDRTRLSSEEVVASFDKIFEKVSNNKPASDAELIKFHANNNAEMPRVPASNTESTGSTTGVDTTGVDEEFEARRRDAVIASDVLWNSKPGYSSLDRVNHLVDFFAEEQIIGSETESRRATEVLDGIRESSKGEEKAARAFDLMVNYFKDIFEVNPPETTATENNNEGVSNEDQ